MRKKPPGRATESDYDEGVLRHPRAFGHRLQRGFDLDVDHAHVDIAAHQHYQDRVAGFDQSHAVLAAADHEAFEATHLDALERAVQGHENLRGDGAHLLFLCLNREIAGNDDAVAADDHAAPDAGRLVELGEYVAHEMALRYFAIATAAKSRMLFSTRPNFTSDLVKTVRIMSSN